MKKVIQNLMAKNSSKKNSIRKNRFDIVRENKRKLATRVKGHHKKFNLTIGKKFAKVILLVITLFLIIGLAGSVYAFSILQQWTEEIPSVDEPFKNPPVSTQLYDRNGNTVLYKVIGSQNSDEVNISEIPELVKWSFIAAEDVNFYTHNGFDTSGMIRCGVKYVTGGGGSLCGASTITQQMLKITALNKIESRVERKVKEIFMATRVEQLNEKDDILQIYLSVAPFGSNVVGVETASKYYFGKGTKDLTLAQATILAAIVQNPSYLSPTVPVNGDVETAQVRVKARQQYVLDQLSRYKNLINDQIKENAKKAAQQNGTEYSEESLQLLTDEQIEEAREEELKYKAPIATDKLAGHFVDFALAELQTKNYKNGEEPFTLADLQNGGYRITTTLDYELQKIAEETAKKYGDEYTYWNVHNLALMTMTPSNGEIITMAGSKSFAGEKEGCDANGENCWYDPQVNVLTSLQSPGSTNKPLAYYLAFEQGLLYPGSLLPDVPLKIGDYDPKNWDSRYRGVEQTAKEMLRQSRNMPALITIEMVGVSNYVQAARDFGYTTYTDESQLGHSVVLGGTSVYPYEHAAAFGVFANQGDYVATESILKIEDREGNIIYEAKPQRKEVASPQGTYLLNQALHNLFDSVSRNISWDGRDVAGKTGTSENNIDSWLVMYSPDFVTIGWAGNNNNDPLNPTYGYPGYVVSPWLLEYMARIGDAPYFRAKTAFSRPGFVTQGGGCESSQNECIGLERDWIIEGRDYANAITRQRATVCTDQPNRLAREIDINSGNSERRRFRHYRMPATNWQNFLDDYIKDQGGSNGAPTEECDIDRTGGVSGPVFSLSSPTNGQAVSNQIRVRGTIFTSSGSITTVRYEFNGSQVGPTDNKASGLDVRIDISVNPGVYPFRIIATDSSGRTNTYSANIVVGDFVSWENEPTSGNQNVAVRVNNQGSVGINNVRFYAARGNNTEEVTLNQIGGSNVYAESWTPSGNGNYTYYAIVRFAGGGNVRLDGGNVTIN